MLSPGRVEPVKEQDCSPLVWKVEVAWARTLSVSLCFAMGCSSLSMATTGPEPASRPSWSGVPLCVPALRCRVSGQVGAHPHGPSGPSEVPSTINHSHCCPAWQVLVPHLPLTRAVLILRSHAGSVTLPGELRSLRQGSRTWEEPWCA